MKHMGVTQEVDNDIGSALVEVLPGARSRTGTGRKGVAQATRD